MKLRWKIVITILLAFLAVWLQGVLEDRTKVVHASSGRCEGLNVWYKTYNERYFDNKLPEDAIVDYGEYNDDYMATTSKLPNGTFHIGLNEKFTSAARVAHLVILHEQCHIATWNEAVDHGPRWRVCMLGLDIMGANRGLLIDGYTGN